MFDWDQANIQHIARHDVTPDEVEEVFADISFELETMTVSNERRFSVVGQTGRGRILIVWYTWRGDALRTISAWDATKTQKLRYLHARESGYDF